MRLLSSNIYESSNLSFKIENVSILSGFAKNSLELFGFERVFLSQTVFERSLELVSGTNQLKQTEINLCNALPAVELLKFNRGRFLKGGAQGERGKQGKEQNEQNVNFERFFAICRLGTCKMKELMI